jgi:hypothetical protein
MHERAKSHEGTKSVAWGGRRGCATANAATAKTVATAVIMMARAWLFMRNNSDFTMGFLLRARSGSQPRHLMGSAWSCQSIRSTERMQEKKQSRARFHHVAGRSTRLNCSVRMHSPAVNQRRPPELRNMTARPVRVGSGHEMLIASRPSPVCARLRKYRCGEVNGRLRPTPDICAGTDIRSASACASSSSIRPSASPPRPTASSRSTAW